MTLRLALFCAMSSCLVACGGVEEPGYRSGFGGPGKLDQTEMDEVCRAETRCEEAPPVSENRCVFVAAFDGSGVYSPEYGSNIGKLYQETRGPEAHSGSNGKRAEVVGADTTRAYIEGVPGLPFGASRERVDRGLSAICQHLDKRKEHCDIVLLGYSRGAFIANQIARALNNYGCKGGKHKGAEIAFFGVFDPVNTQMGYEWKSPSGASQSWSSQVPSNVARLVQVFKSPYTDPRGGIEGMTLTTSPLWGAKGYACERPMRSTDKDDDTPWHHGQIGHSKLTGDVIRCALKRSNIDL